MADLQYQVKREFSIYNPNQTYSTFTQLELRKTSWLLILSRRRLVGPIVEAAVPCQRRSYRRSFPFSIFPHSSLNLFATKPS